jgi:ketosteroid isomerase-like protein
MSAIEEAKKAMEDYFAAFNAQDVEAIRKHLHFPFSWIINTRVRPVATASEFESPTQTLIETEGWHHSEFDYIEPVQVWENKIHFKLAYSRFKADGTKYMTHEALWIVTKVEGRWGICLMSLNFPKTA